MNTPSALAVSFLHQSPGGPHLLTDGTLVRATQADFQQGDSGCSIVGVEINMREIARLLIN